MPHKNKNGSSLTATPVRVGALKPVFSSTRNLFNHLVAGTASQYPGLTTK